VLVVKLATFGGDGLDLGATGWREVVFLQLPRSTNASVRALQL
jgi:hypothetical protein